MRWCTVAFFSSTAFVLACGGSTTTGNYGGASGVVARFDAVFPPSVPSHVLADWNGSFL